jgi:hypothetical protein
MLAYSIGKFSLRSHGEVRKLLSPRYLNEEHVDTQIQNNGSGMENLLLKSDSRVVCRLDFIQYLDVQVFALQLFESIRMQ